MSDRAPIQNLRQHISSLAERQPDRPALVGVDETGRTVEEVTYLELADRMDATAGYLRSLSLREGDKVALAFKNSVELLVLSWAAWASGVVTVPLDTKRDTPVLCAYKVDLNKVKLVIAQKGLGDMVGAQSVPVLELADIPACAAEVLWKEGLAHQALVLFTSGTTSHPKGAKLSLENLVVNAEGIRQWLRIGDTDRFLVQLPLHHINSTTFCLSTLLAGGTVVIPPAYSNSHFWEQIAHTKATVTSIVQSILADQLERTREYEEVKDDVALTRIQIGSAPVVAHTVEEFITRFGTLVYQGYGQTETALRVTGVPMGLSEERYRQLVEENSIGVAMPWAEVEIASKDGSLLGEGEEGELVVKGAAVMEGYVGGESAFRDGYFLTGDIGLYKMIDGQRFFFLKGRSREIIIKGGINISPVAVENSLKKISPDIAQVYCVGVPDDRYGEEVGAVVCWKEGADAARAMRRLKLTLLSGTDVLSAYETPRYLATVAAESLPLTSTGKVQRTVIKSRIEKGQFESVYDIAQTPRYRFVLLSPRSPYVAASHALYNHAWQPLTTDIATYTRDIGREWIIMAVDADGKLAGQIATIRTDLSADEILKTPYADLFAPRALSARGKVLVCISICSAEYAPKPVPQVRAIPDANEVRAYLASGSDPVMRFHAKPKGGFERGASLVDVIPGGRPEDASALGYNMLVEYPAPSGVAITDGAPVSNQLIEAALLIAEDLGLANVYAYSRPGGLAAYVARGSSAAS